MLQILGRPDRRARFCDGISRRGFLQIGGAALGGLALNQLLRHEARAGVGSSQRAIINIYLPGGPPHHGHVGHQGRTPRRRFAASSSRSAPTCRASKSASCFPRIARMADKFIFVRSLADSDGDHDAYQCMTGRKRGEPRPPTFGR